MTFELVRISPLFSVLGCLTHGHTDSILQLTDQVEQELNSISPLVITVSSHSSLALAVALSPVSPLSPTSPSMPIPPTYAPNSKPSSPTENVTVQVNPEDIPKFFYPTSVHDHTLREAFGRVMQNLLKRTCLLYIEELLNVFCSNSHASKAYLFDTRARMYVATDSSPVDVISHNVCVDYVKMLQSFGDLFK